jgi:hypothetical protein
MDVDASDSRGNDDGMIGTILKIVYAELVGASQALRDAIDRFYPSRKPAFYGVCIYSTKKTNCQPHLFS